MLQALQNNTYKTDLKFLIYYNVIMTIMVIYSGEKPYKCDECDR